MSGGWNIGGGRGVVAIVNPSSPRLVLAGAAALVLLIACSDTGPSSGAENPPTGTTTPPATSAEAGPGRAPGGGDLTAPPPVTIHYSGQSAELEPWTFCYANGCADGSPPEHPLDVGDPSEVVVTYPLEGWSFTASLTPADEECGRVQRTTLEPGDDGRFVLRPVGFAGTYDVTLTGRGDGDLAVSFRWTTRSDGRLPNPRAYLGVVTDDDDEILSYGVEMSITNLAETPEDLAARVTVTAGDGDAITFTPRLASRGCRPEGSLYWDGPQSKGHEAARLGEPPFEYEVDLTLDGRTYIGRGTWPGDEIRNYAPYVRLEFEPDLPSLAP